MSNKTHQLALFGNPVGHSLSPQIHQQFASQFGLKLDYRLIQVNEAGFSEAVTEFFNAGGLGANVTLPHKSLALFVVDKIKKNAKLSQAANTIYKNKKSQLCGDNTDGKGFVEDVNKRLGFNFSNKSILILGAGGATQGIVPAILNKQPKNIIIANRSLDKAEKICTFKNTHAISYENIESYKQQFDLIIHATSLGYHGKTLKFHSHHVHKKTVGYDLSYGITAMPFIEFCQSNNLTQISDGLGMLVEQAAFAFKKWFYKKPSTEIIYQTLSNKN